MILATATILRNAGKSEEFIRYYVHKACHPSTEDLTIVAQSLNQTLVIQNTNQTEILAASGSELHSLAEKMAATTDHTSDQYLEMVTQLQDLLSNHPILIHKVNHFDLLASISKP